MFYGFQLKVILQLIINQKSTEVYTKWQNKIHIVCKFKANSVNE